MRFGIPKYRLPRDVLDAEMQRIVEMGVTVKLDAKVDDLARTMKEGGYDAAFLAVGAHIAKRAFIPAKDSARILDAVAVLRSMEGEEQPMLGRRVVVYGGGNTAHRRRPHRQAPGRHRGRHRLPAHARAHAGARLRGRGGARGRRPGQVAVDHQAGRRR